MPTQVLLRDLPVSPRISTSPWSTVDPRSPRSCSTSSPRSMSGYARSRHRARARHPGVHTPPKQARPSHHSGRIAYRARTRRAARAQGEFDLTSDEVMTQPPTLRGIGRHYSDEPPSGRRSVLSDHRVVREKLRALAERCRPRDSVRRRPPPSPPGPGGTIHRGCPGPRKRSARTQTSQSPPWPRSTVPVPSRVENEWEHAGHQLPKSVPPFADWATLNDVVRLLGTGTVGSWPGWDCDVCVRALRFEDLATAVESSHQVRVAMRSGRRSYRSRGGIARRAPGASRRTTR